MASPLPCRNDRFGRPYTMLNADSSTLKSESDVQSRRDAADDAERRRVVLNGVDEADDLVDRRPRERLLDLPDEERGLVRAPGQAQQGERRGRSAGRRRGARSRRSSRRGAGRGRRRTSHQIPSADSHAAQYLRTASASRHASSGRRAARRLMLRDDGRQQALADLTEISSADPGRRSCSTTRARSPRSTLAESPRGRMSWRRRPAGCSPPPTRSRPARARCTQLEVRDRRRQRLRACATARRSIAATTGSNPTAGLVFYDLKSALRSVKPAAKPVQPAKKKPRGRARRRRPPRRPPRRRRRRASRRPRKKPDAS